ncbi:hypothetical protein DFY64_16535 [Escherichia coli]|nr:hypothetical protein [Escherichia coli]EEY9251099.1 hypothetical protein [Escherichia coli]
MFHTIVSIKNDGHYFCRAGGNRPDGLNEPVTTQTIAIAMVNLTKKNTAPTCFDEVFCFCCVYDSQSCRC